MWTSGRRASSARSGRISTVTRDFSGASQQITIPRCARWERISLWQIRSGRTWGCRQALPSIQHTASTSIRATASSPRELISRRPLYTRSATRSDFFRASVTRKSSPVRRRRRTYWICSASAPASGGEHVFFGGGPELALSTGRSNYTGGDGQQAGHWKDELFTGRYIGIMSPTFARGLHYEMTA